MREMAIKDHGWGELPAKSVRYGRSLVFWRAATYTGFSVAAMLMIAGLTVSALAAVSLVPTSRFTGYMAVILLFSSFVSAFLGAHSLDKLTVSKHKDTGESSGSDSINFGGQR